MYHKFCCSKGNGLQVLEIDVIYVKVVYCKLTNLKQNLTIKNQKRAKSITQTFLYIYYVPTLESF